MRILGRKWQKKNNGKNKGHGISAFDVRMLGGGKVGFSLWKGIAAFDSPSRHNERVGDLAPTEEPLQFALGFVGRSRKRKLQIRGSRVTLLFFLPRVGTR